MSVGLAHQLQSGGVAKAKVDNKGLLSLLYESPLEKGGARVTLSGQVDTTAPGSSPPRIGVGVDLSA